MFQPGVMKSRFIFRNLLWFAALLLVTAFARVQPASANAPLWRVEAARAYGMLPMHAFRCRLKASVAACLQVRDALPSGFETSWRTGRTARHLVCILAFPSFIPPGNGVRPPPGGRSSSHALLSERLSPRTAGANGKRAPPFVS
jgi:hypothetical protein